MSNGKEILIFGCPRSGTTWIGKIFDSHSRTIYKHEPDSVYKLKTVPHFASVDKFDQYKSTLLTFFEKIKKNNSLHVVGKTPLFSKQYLNTVQFSLFKSSVYFSKFINKYLNYKLPVLNFASKAMHENNWLVWKSIESVSRLGIFAKAYSQAKVVLLVRHPCGQVNSYLKGGTDKNMIVDLGDDIDETIWKACLQTEQAARYGLTLEKVKAMSLVEQLAWDWLISNEKAIEELKQSENTKVVYYDDFCVDPISESKQLFKFCDLPWDQQTQDFIEESVGRNEKEYFSVFKDPFVAANKWRNEMDKHDIEVVREIVMNSTLLRDHFETSFNLDDDALIERPLEDEAKPAVASV